MLRKRLFLCMAAFAVSICFFAPVVDAKEDAYDKLAEEFSNAANMLNPPKIAIIPFSYIDKRKSDGGTIVAERLTTRIVKIKKLQVIERQLLENVIQELHLETSGVVDAETTKKLGKVLGVTAIINGTLLDVEDGMVEINARIINTETAEVITTASAEIRKIWADVPTNQPAPSQQAPQQPAYAPPPQYQPAYQPPRYGRGTNGFFDIFTGFGGGTMQLTFNNPNKLAEWEFSLDLNGNGYLDLGFNYSKISIKNIKTESSSMPFGIRFGGFGKNFGGDFELSYFSQNIIRQTCKYSLDGGPDRNFSFYGNDYLTVKSFNLAGDLLIRFSDQMIQPYVGLGIGMTINSISSPYIYQFYGSTYKKPLDATEIGFLFRIPIGVRIKFGDSAYFFGEYRMSTNSISFDRDVKRETDSISLSTSNLLLGLSAEFGGGQSVRGK